jgi:hypothetical protein
MLLYSEEHSENVAFLGDWFKRLANYEDIEADFYDIVRGSATGVVTSACL